MILFCTSTQKPSSKPTKGVTPASKPRPAPASKPRPAPAPVEPPRNVKKPIFWTGVGVASALLITGTVTGILAYQRSEDFNDPATPHRELQDLYDSGRSLRTAATATLISGGAVAAGTALFYLLYKEKPESLVSVSASPGGIVVRGSF